MEKIKKCEAKTIVSLRDVQVELIFHGTSVSVKIYIPYDDLVKIMRELEIDV